ncbi:MAG: TolC family protein, partial [Chloroflexi bacterium]|nr:TolC family protein [Chloroflexota bacterium]
LVEGGALSAARREAEAALVRARAAEKQVRLQVNNEVAAALTNRTAARQNLVTSRVGLNQALEDYGIQTLRYQSGKGIQLEMLDALAALTTARSQVDRAEFELAVADDQLLRATGVILSPRARQPHD